jgi:hypothetical protein
MPRGKRTVFAAYCADENCPHPGSRIGSFRFHKQDKMGKGWKEHTEGMMKYCPEARRRVKLRWKEEKHSS